MIVWFEVYLFSSVFFWIASAEEDFWDVINYRDLLCYNITMTFWVTENIW